MNFGILEWGWNADEETYYVAAKVGPKRGPFFLDGGGGGHGDGHGIEK